MSDFDDLSAMVESVLDRGGGLEMVTSGLVAALSAATTDGDLSTLFQERKSSYTAYADPARHFIVHCSVHAPGHITEAHDHGEAWAVYGVVRGRSRYRKFDRGSDPEPGRALLSCTRDDELEPGQTDVVLPGQVHLVANETTAPAWNLVLRPRPISQVWRRRFELESGEYVIHPGSLPRAATDARSTEA